MDKIYCDYSVTLSTAACVGDPPIGQITGITDVCADRSIDLTAENIASGQSSGNTFSWVGPNGFTASTASISHFDPTGGSGTYTCTITNADGCVAEVSVVVTVFDALLIDISGSAETSPGAGDGNISATVSGGAMPYLISIVETGDFNFDGQFTGSYTSGSNYTIEVVDGNACILQQVFTMP